MQHHEGFSWSAQNRTSKKVKFRQHKVGAGITTQHDCTFEDGRGFFIKLDCGDIHNINQRKQRQKQIIP